MNEFEYNGEVCFANIGVAQRRLRLGFGVLMAAAAGGVAGALIVSGAPRLMRLLVFPLVSLAATGFLQYRGRT